VVVVAVAMVVVTVVVVVVGAAPLLVAMVVLEASAQTRVQARVRAALAALEVKEACSILAAAAVLKAVGTSGMGAIGGRQTRVTRPKERAACCSRLR